jgi:site-specific recombinase XerD
MLFRICEEKLGHKWTTKATPHRFRHSFARILLQKGESPATVAQLLGNTEDVVLEYYATWVEERQQKLSAMMRENFKDVPNPMTRRKGALQLIKAS